MSDDLSYRPCVGVALVNRDGDVFIGHRKRRRGGERLDERSWQMPQGGIDDGEAPLEAAKRELWEETNVRSVELIAELPDWQSYDLPEEARGRWAGRYRGQTQKWFLFRFLGPDSEIDVHHPAGGAHGAEFDDWRWEPFDRLPDVVVPFKRQVYEAVAAAFAPLAKARQNFREIRSIGPPGYRRGGVPPPEGAREATIGASGQNQLPLLPGLHRGQRQGHLLAHLLAQPVVGEVDIAAGEFGP